MLYEFPPPVWFQIGTTSHRVGLIVAWIVATGLTCPVPNLDDLRPIGLHIIEVVPIR